jgi:type IV pilus biogenesis protein CpaD/CtpE
MRNVNISVHANVKPFLLGLAFCLAVLLVSGCTHEPSAHYRPGNATRALLAAQVVNPSAPDDRTPVDGMRGDVSEAIFLNRYVKDIAAEQDDEDDEGGGGE